MAAAAAAALGERLKGGVVVGATHAPGRAVGPVEHIAGGHPVPNEDSQRAGLRALAAARAAGAGDQLLVLLSGGASAMLAVPAAGLTLADKQQATAVLLREGAEIHALNTVRKHLSAIKGGQLAAAAGAASRTLLISDVVGDDPSVIASGPTVADPSTFVEALDALDRAGRPRGLSTTGRRPPRARRAGGWPETPKPGDPRLRRAEVARRRRAPPRDGGRGGRGQAPRIPCRRARPAGRRRSPRGGGRPHQARWRRPPACRALSASFRAARRRSTSPAAGAAAATRSSPWLRRPFASVSGPRPPAGSPARERRHGRRGRADRCRRRARRPDDARSRDPRGPARAQRRFSTTTTPTHFLRLWAISSRRGRPAQTSATSRCFCRL